MGDSSKSVFGGTPIEANTEVGFGVQDPAIPLLRKAITALERDQPKAAARWLKDAMGELAATHNLHPEF